MKAYKFKLFSILVVLQIILIVLCNYFPKSVEIIYSNGIYLIISALMRFSFGWLPFSVGDIIYTLLIAYMFRWLFVHRKRIVKDTINWGLDIATALVIGYTSFLLLWGYNYYRPPINDYFEFKTDYSTEALLHLTERLIGKSNHYQKQITNNDTLKVVFPYSKEEVHGMLSEGFENLAKTHPDFSYSPKSIKPSVYSLGISYMGFSGYLNPFTNEAQVNAKIPKIKYPTTACHEVAHQLGYAAENEANFIGALAAIANTDIYFKYAGYTFALRYCLSDLYRKDIDIYKRTIKKINPGIFKNFAEVRMFWKSYENPLEPLFEKTYDTFLKANNQPKGIKSYNYVVALLVNYFETATL